MDIETSAREPFARTVNSNSNSPQKTNTSVSTGMPQAESVPQKPSELHHFLTDIEDLIREATSLTGEELQQVRLKINASLATARNALEKMGGEISESAKSSAASTNEYVHHQPWVAVGVGAVVGLLAGFLLTRSKH